MKNLTDGGLRSPQGVQGNPISKIPKSLIQNGSPNPHPKFQHSSSIRKCLKIGGKIRLLGGFKGPRFQKIEIASLLPVRLSGPAARELPQFLTARVM